MQNVTFCYKNIELCAASVKTVRFHNNNNGENTPTQMVLMCKYHQMHNIVEMLADDDDDDVHCVQSAFGVGSKRTNGEVHLRATVCI